MKLTDEFLADYFGIFKDDINERKQDRDCFSFAITGYSTICEYENMKELLKESITPSSIQQNGLLIHAARLERSDSSIIKHTNAIGQL